MGEKRSKVFLQLWWKYRGFEAMVHLYIKSYNVIISIVANVFSPTRCTTYFAYRDQGCVHIKINAMYKPGPLQCTKLLITLAATFVQ